MNIGTGCSWPEQEAVENWVEKHNISISFEQKRELKTAVSEYRIAVQKEAKLERIAALPWYKKDKLGWPIETIKGRHGLNFVRVLLQNLRKLTS